MPNLILVTSSKALLSNIVTLGVKTLREFWGDTIKFITSNKAKKNKYHIFCGIIKELSYQEVMLKISRIKSKISDTQRIEKNLNDI